MTENAASLSLLFQRLETCLRAASRSDTELHLQAAELIRKEIEVRVTNLQVALFSRPQGAAMDTLLDEN